MRRRPSSPGSFAIRSLLALAILALVFVVLRRVDEHESSGGVVGTTGTPPVEAVQAPLALPAPSTAARGIPAIAAELEATAPAATTAVAAREVRVEVVDAFGQPAVGATVSMQSPAVDETWAIETTDEAGHATLTWNAADIADSTVLRLGTVGIESTPPHVEFTPSTVPSDFVRFTLAPSGEIELVLTGGEQYPLDGEAVYRLNSRYVECESDASSRLHGTFGHGRLEGRTTRIRHIGLNLCFSADCTVRGVEYADAQFLGPQTAGAVVRVELQFEQAYKRTFGRVLNGDGLPVPRAHVTVIGREEPGAARQWQRMFESSTDESGRFEYFSRPWMLSEHTPRAEFRVTRGGALVQSGIVPWPEERMSTDGADRLLLDFGDVRVESEAMIAAGHVVDGAGAPMGRWMDIQLRSLEPDMGPTWNKVEALLDHEGRFQVGLDEPIQRFELRAHKGGYAPSAPVACTRGAQDVELVLRDACRIEGRVLVADGIPADELDVRIECVDPPRSEDHATGSLESDDDGRFKMSSMEPGLYAVRCSLDDHELLVREARLANYGDVLQLEPFDLRTVLARLRVQVVADGAPDLQDGWVTVLADDEQLGMTRLTSDGRADLVTLAGLVDVIVYLPGFRTTRFAAVADEARLVMEPGFPFVARVTNAPTLSDGRGLELRLRAIDEDPLADATCTLAVEFAGDGTARGRAALRGNYRIEVVLSKPGVPRYAWMPIALAHPATLRVTGDASTDEFTLELDADSMRAVLEKTQPR